MPVAIPKPTMKDDTNPNPNAGPDENGLHNRSMGTKRLPDESETGEHDNKTDKQTKQNAKDKAHDDSEDHAKDQDYKKYDKVELVGNVSELATIVLNTELKKIKRIAEDTRIIVITDKEDVKGLIPLITESDRKMGVYHNSQTHLPLYDRATEEWLSANDIPYSADMGKLLFILGAR